MRWRLPERGAGRGGRALGAHLPSGPLRPGRAAQRPALLPCSAAPRGPARAPARAAEAWGRTAQRGCGGAAPSGRGAPFSSTGPRWPGPCGQTGRLAFAGFRPPSSLSRTRGWSHAHTVPPFIHRSHLDGHSFTVRPQSADGHSLSGTQVESSPGCLVISRLFGTRRPHGSQGQLAPPHFSPTGHQAPAPHSPAPGTRALSPEPDTGPWALGAALASSRQGHPGPDTGSGRLHLRGAGGRRAGGRRAGRGGGGEPGDPPPAGPHSRVPAAASRSRQGRAPRGPLSSRPGRWLARWLPAEETPAEPRGKHACGHGGSPPPTRPTTRTSSGPGVQALEGKGARKRSSRKAARADSFPCEWSARRVTAALAGELRQRVQKGASRAPGERKAGAVH